MKSDLRTILQNNGLPKANFAREMETRRLLAQMVLSLFYSFTSANFLSDVF
jgi:hypothetical protein